MIKKNFEEDRLSWEFEDGSSRKALFLESVAIGKGIYYPGWRWSLHAQKETGKQSERHIGYLLEGEMMVRDSGGNEMLVCAGEAFEVGENHDAWVVGNDPCIALDVILR